jgi:hypothetical protein
MDDEALEDAGELAAQAGHSAAVRQSLRDGLVEPCEGAGDTLLDVRLRLDLYPMQPFQSGVKPLLRLLTVCTQLRLKAGPLFAADGAGLVVVPDASLVRSGLVESVLRGPDFGGALFDGRLARPLERSAGGVLIHDVLNEMRQYGLVQRLPGDGRH